MAHGNLFTRPDTFLGVCEAIGGDLGFDPNWLRLALGVGMLWQPVWIVCGYLAAAVLILALRLAVPDPALAAPTMPTEGASDGAAPALARAA